MNTIRIKHYGGPDVLRLEHLDSPTPGPDDVTVRNHVIGVNFKDTGERSSGPAERLPFTPGVEAAGVVHAVGKDVTGWKAGDRVCYVVNHGGAYAEAVVVPAERIVALPDDIDFATAAAMAVNGMTAHYLLHEFHAVTPGTVVLVHAAAGGMGLILVQWAKHLGGTVIGTVSTEEKARAAREAGADHVILYTEQDFVAETRRLSGGRGADLVIDGVGKTTVPGSLEAVRERGSVVVYGNASGPPEPIQPLALIQRSRRLAGADLFDYIRDRDDLLRRSAAVFDGVRRGFLKRKTVTTLPLADAAKAHRMLEDRGNIGKLVLSAHTATSTQQHG